MNRNRRFAACILIGIILVFLDQCTKYLAETFLKPKGYVTVIPGVLELRYLENRGAAFGMLQNRQWIFVVFAICCVISGLPQKTGTSHPLSVCRSLLPARQGI